MFHYSQNTYALFKVIWQTLYFVDLPIQTILVFIILPC